MGLILLEALGALLLLVLIVWWTMFSGRKNGELPERAPEPTQPEPDTAEESPDPASAVLLNCAANWPARPPT